MRKPTAPAPRKKPVKRVTKVTRVSPVRQARAKAQVEELPAGEYQARVASIGYDVLDKTNTNNDVLDRLIGRSFVGKVSPASPYPMRFTPSLTINTNKNEYYLHSLEVPMTLDQISEYIENMVDSARRLTHNEDITSLQVVLVVHEPT